MPFDGANSSSRATRAAMRPLPHVAPEAERSAAYSFNRPPSDDPTTVALWRQANGLKPLPGPVETRSIAQIVEDTFAAHRAATLRTHIGPAEGLQDSIRRANEYRLRMEDR